jgi:glucosamine--fructose-6-phosphate aminotransferase (isomerizing)
MCGIIAAVANNKVLDSLLFGLERLEYRGYDSAGIAVLIEGKIITVKTAGKIRDLRSILSGKDLNSIIGIAHTRWATHGEPSSINAHPHTTEEASVVHNGIIENYTSLKQDLLDLGYVFKSETDTEVVAGLLQHNLSAGLSPVDASRLTIAKLSGAFALVFMFEKHNLLFATANKTPLVLGIAPSGVYIASDACAFNSSVEKLVYLEDGDKVIVRENSWEILDRDYKICSRSFSPPIAQEEVSKRHFPNFMLKEIYEQPLTIERVLNRYIYDRDIMNCEIDLTSTSQINISACGSAYNAGMIARYWIEEFAGIPVYVEIASEYRNRISARVPNSLTVVISQSGETLDTVESLRKSKIEGQKIVSIVNNERSTIARLSDKVFPILAGTEIGVASTKAYIGQLSVLALIGLYIGQKRKHISQKCYQEALKALFDLPCMISEVLTQVDHISSIAEKLMIYRSMLFIGRGTLYPTALEAALKMKELTYIHAEAYAAGELKHGPISLIDTAMPVIALIQTGSIADKTFSNIQEVEARGAKVIYVGHASEINKAKCAPELSIILPDCDPLISPILHTVALQLLAYYVCVKLGHDADQPRNLAKSVTVE